MLYIFASIQAGEVYREVAGAAVDAVYTDRGSHPSAYYSRLRLDLKRVFCFLASPRVSDNCKEQSGAKDQRREDGEGGCEPEMIGNRA